MVIVLFLGMVATEVVYVKVVNLSLRDCNIQDTMREYLYLYLYKRYKRNNLKEKNRL